MSRFSTLPTVNISRSKFKRTSTYKTSFNLGEIVPVYVDEVLPGDTRSITLGSLIRMSTPVAPIMDDIKVDFYAFFVPNRLVWDHWKEFMGENNVNAGAVAPTTYSVPSKDILQNGNHVDSGSLGDYLGLPITTNINSVDTLKVSLLPLRGYRLIYNRWFRDQNIESPLGVSKGDTAGVYDLFNAPLLTAMKFSDYFTRALPYAQKGAPVQIPLPVSMPITGLDSLNIEADGKFSFSNGGDVHSYLISNALGPSGTQNIAAAFSKFPEDVSKNLDPGSAGFYNGGLKVSADDAPYIDLDQSTNATINQLRFAFQYQKLLEKDALYGTRYWEILKAHFGVTAPDASLQDPEFLGHFEAPINIDQVLQTTDADKSSPSQNGLGEPGANSVTGSHGHLFSKSFTEHGHIFVLAVCRHKNTYGQGLNRMWSRVNRTDFYFPEFANLGCQPIYNKEIFVGAAASDNEAAFGFQEAWAEYRYKPSIVTGLLRPNVTGNLGYWTLSENYASLPTLSYSWMKQDRNNLARCLSTGITGPDFIADFAFVDVAVRPMPLYSIPGLVDHH